MNRNLLPVVLMTFVAMALLGCGTDKAAPSIPTINVQLNWYPESEHGGVFQAQAEDLYTKSGLNVVIKPGGPSTPIVGELQLGRSQFAIANADDVVLYRRSGADIVALAAIVQNHPRCILVREESGVTSLDKLAGMTLQREAGQSFVEFMRKKGLLEGVQEVPYLGTVTSLVADPKIAIQAYLFSEPLQAEQAGAKVRALMVSELGWNPYSSLLVTTGDMIRNQPAQVQTMVDATLDGWRSYITNPEAGNELILKANKHGLTSDTLKYGVTKLRELALPDGMAIDQVGIMTDERWTTLIQQMDDLDPAAAGKVKASDCYTLEFLNK
jgi:NitT/TauT family transport system substrate-binding protein